MVGQTKLFQRRWLYKLMNKNEMTDVGRGANKHQQNTIDSVTQWLVNFSSCVRRIDYDSALLLVHPEVVAFGTYSDIMHGRDSWVSNQWKHIWPVTSGFSFDIDRMHVMVSQDNNLVTIAVPWSSTGYEDNGAPFARTGRATMTLEREAEEWLCVHSHMSLCRSASQQGATAQTPAI